MLAGFVIVNAAPAQKRALRVVIPFDFSASGTKMPAGAYTIAIQNGFTSIVKDSTGESTVVTAIPVEDNLPDDSKVVFSIYGDRHFLRKILCPRLNVSLELLPSKSEIKTRQQTLLTRVVDRVTLFCQPS